MPIGSALTREPILLLDENHLIDHRSKAALIPWSEIEDVGVTRIMGQALGRYIFSGVKHE